MPAGVAHPQGSQSPVSGNQSVEHLASALTCARDEETEAAGELVDAQVETAGSVAGFTALQVESTRGVARLDKPTAEQ